MHIIDTTALISINGTMLVQLVSFLVFLVIINRVMFKPLRRTILERDSYVDTLQQDMADAEEALRRESAELERRKDAVRDEALSVTQTLEAEAKQEADKILEAARKEIGRLKDQTTADVAARIAEAKKQLAAETEVLTVQIMEKVLDRRV